MPIIKNRYKYSFGYKNFVLSSCIICLLIFVLPRNLLIIDYIGNVLSILGIAKLPHKCSNVLVNDKIKILEKENEQMRLLLKFVPDPKLNYVSAKLIVVFSGYIKSALIAAGSEQGVKQHQIVLCEGCLLGRVTEVGKNYSKILLAGDVSSHIPVVTANSRQRGILTGNQNNLLLRYVDGDKIENNELLTTSGDGNFYPIGLPVARISSIGIKHCYACLLCDLKTVEMVTIVQNASEEYVGAEAFKR